jgi:hypothetical protein
MTAQPTHLFFHLRITSYELHDSSIALAIKLLKKILSKGKKKGVLRHRNQTKR